MEKLVTIQDQETRHDLIEGNVVVAPGGHLTFHGLVKGEITVMPTGILELHGTAQSIWAHPQSRVAIYGTVQGDVGSQGDLVIAGVVRGKVEDFGGEVTIEAGARVREVAYLEHLAPGGDEE